MTYRFRSVLIEPYNRSGADHVTIPDGSVGIEVHTQLVPANSYSGPGMPGVHYVLITWMEPVHVVS